MFIFLKTEIILSLNEANTKTTKHDLDIHGQGKRILSYTGRVSPLRRRVGLPWKRYPHWSAGQENRKSS